jgi:hypothetical protein
MYKGIGIALALLASSTARASPWVKAPGAVFLEAGVSRFQEGVIFGERSDTGLDFDSTSYTIYGEVGLPLRSQILFSFPYVVARNRTLSGLGFVSHTIGDARIELDRSILDDPALPITAGLEVKLPLYTRAAEDDLPNEVSIYPSGSFPDPGDGNVDLLPKLSIGLSSLPYWLTAELGYRLRFGDFDDALFAAVSGGAFIIPESFAAFAYVSTDLSPGRQLVYVQLRALVRSTASWLPKFGLALGPGAVVYAAEARAGLDFSFSITYESP